MSLGRPFTGTGAYCQQRDQYGRVPTLSDERMRPRRMTETAAELPGEMGVVAEAARVGDLTHRLARVQQRPAVQQARGVIQAGRIHEMRAGRIARGKELLEVAQRDPRFDRHLGRTEGRIGGTILYDAANALEQFVAMRRDRRQIGRCK